MIYNKMQVRTDTETMIQLLQGQRAEWEYLDARIPRLISELQTNESVLSQFVYQLQAFNVKLHSILVAHPYQITMPDSNRLFQHVSGFIKRIHEQCVKDADAIAVLTAHLQQSRFDMDNYHKQHKKRINSLLDQKSYAQIQLIRARQSEANLDKQLLRQSLTQCRYTKTEPHAILNSATNQRQLKFLKEKIKKLEQEIKEMEQKQLLVYGQSNKSIGRDLIKVREAIQKIINYKKEQKCMTFKRSCKAKQSDGVNLVSEFESNQSSDLSQCIEDAIHNCRRQTGNKEGPSYLKDALKLAFLAQSKQSN